MAIEIERKFLVRHLPDLEGVIGQPMSQGYLRADASGSVRLRISGESAILNVKGPTRDGARLEFEYPVPTADAREMLAALAVAEPVEKVRYRIEHEGYLWELDVFGGRNHGLVIAEVELDAATDDPPLPEWVGREVTDDPRYYNAYLSRNPYDGWSQRAGGESDR
ncbi:MAG: CYTH domain-containing protein [Pseudomonadales bacterium]